MNKTYNASYKFSFGEISFQVDIDETLSSEVIKKDFPVTKAKVLHDHPFYELFFVFDDEMEIVFEKETKKFKNSIVCLSPNTKHYTVRSSDYRILVSYNTKHEAKSGFEGFITHFFGNESVRHIPTVSSGLSAYLKELCNIFYNQKSELDREAIISLLKCILHNIYSLYTDNGSINNQGYFTNESRYIIISSLITGCTTSGNEITISTLADALCLSKKQTSRLISKYYGKSLTEIITDEKLKYAAYLLKHTDFSIYDIAFESNFHSYSYFCRRFKEKFGCLPLNYRKGNDS